MGGIEAKISGSEKLTSIFGYWPSFHDAEIIDVHFWRGDVNPEKEKYLFPVLTVTFHLWELTNETDAKGFLVLRHHTRSILRFHSVTDFAMQGFNHQNAIFGLAIQQEERPGILVPVFSVEFEPASGMEARFTCLQIEVLTAIPCRDDGEVDN
jgi:hypothetical protein